MNITLDRSAEKFITERVQSGKYPSPEAVVAAALHSLAHDETAGQFAPGEWDALIEEAEASGEALDGHAVLAELRGLRHAARR